MRIHVLQVGYDDSETIDARRARVAEMVRRQEGADLIVLPELWAPTGFSFRNWTDAAEPVEGPTVEAIREAARDIGAYVHAGSIIEAARDEPGEDGRGLFNTSVLLAPNGDVLATYRKIHRFGFGVGEPKLLDAGTQVVTAGLRDGASQVTAGLATCYDLRFPELFRALLGAGTQLLLVPAAWPSPRVAHWSLLGRARALENQCVLVAVNTAGTHGGTQMGGCSQVVGPMGDVIAEAGEAEEVLVVDVDLDEVAEAREKFPVLADRRLGRQEAASLR
jgi:predicted amidohydrolase